MVNMNHDKFDICYCCGKIIGYAGLEFSNGFCSVGCEIADNRPSQEVRQQNYDRSYEEFQKKIKDIMNEEKVISKKRLKMDRRFPKEDYEKASQAMRKIVVQTGTGDDWISISDLLQNAITNIEIIERYEKGREFIVAADSELSAIAHGRPQSDKEELIRISSGLRDIYDRR